jgi:hypothetical protein
LQALPLRTCLRIHLALSTVQGAQFAHMCIASLTYASRTREPPERASGPF